MIKKKSQKKERGQRTRGSPSDYCNSRKRSPKTQEVNQKPAKAEKIRKIKGRPEKEVQKESEVRTNLLLWKYKGLSDSQWKGSVSHYDPIGKDKSSNTRDVAPEVGIPTTEIPN